ncbi:hypothetical protein [Georgenia alba]|uniref:Uncharacterized protein n=1 Tax=Georgenia alba TaxID=2233858 RepID=A0ABW2QBY9_9MICO
MTRRIISVALIVLGLVAVLAAIASATIWRPTDIARLSLPARPDAPLVVTNAGVLDTVGPEVTVRATAGDDDPVTLAVGRTEDVDAWVGSAPHERVTGLASWEELAVETANPVEETTEPAEETTGGGEETTGGEEETTEGAGPEEASVPDPAGSDLWVAEQTGTGSAEMTWTDQDGRWSLLAATDGSGPAPEVSLTWPVEVRTPWLIPGIVVGTVLVLVGVLLLVLQARAGRRARDHEAAVAARADETAVLTAVGSEDAEPGREPHEHGRHRRRRRRLWGRSPEETAAAAIATDQPEAHATDRATDEAGTARGAGIVPASPRATELRAGRDEAQPEDAEPASDVAEPAGPDEGDEPTGASTDRTPTDEAEDETAQTSGWRAMWGFGPTGEEPPATDPHTDEKEQR